MKVHVQHLSESSQKHLGKYVRLLLERILEDLDNVIVKVEAELSSSISSPVRQFDCWCRIRIELRNLGKIQTEACDYDEMLAAYRAVEKAKGLAYLKLQEHSRNETSP